MPVVNARTSGLLVVATVGASIAACAPRPPGISVSAASATAPNEDAQYVIGSGDVLGVFVYNSPELSDASVPVRPDGRISIPLVQDVTAAGKTPRQLADELDQRLRKYVRDPNVTVMVKSFVGPLNSQVKVIGEAVDPEAIPYRNGLTLLDVMIATKGLTRYAAGNRAIVVRHLPNGKQETIHVRLSDLINDGDISQNIKMEPGDTLIIPQTWF